MGRALTGKIKGEFFVAMKIVAKNKPIFTYGDVIEYLGWEHYSGLGTIMTAFKRENIVALDERQQPHSRSKWKLKNVENGNKYLRYLDKVD